jgi:carbon-monoxide dehydrogenase large subunit
MSATSWVGSNVLRKEDERLLTGRGTFLDDLEVAGLLEAAMLRSPHAHARIVSLDASAARALPGVLAVITGTEIEALTNPIRPLIPTPTPVRDFCLATDRVRFVGEPVAAVAAVDRATAEDALDCIQVEYEPLAAVVDPDTAITPAAPLLYDELGTNVLWHDTLVYGDVDGAFAAADGVLRERFEMQRYASTPLETFGCIAEYGGAGACWPTRCACRNRASACAARTSAAGSATNAARRTCWSARCWPAPAVGRSSMSRTVSKT